MSKIDNDYLFDKIADQMTKSNWHTLCIFGKNAVVREIGTNLPIMAPDLSGEQLNYLIHLFRENKKLEKLFK